jgi:hypothetical protein
VPLLCRLRELRLRVSKNDVNCRDDVAQLGNHLLVGRREEVNHPAWAEGDLADGLGGSDGEGLEEVFGAAHNARVRLFDPLW